MEFNVKLEYQLVLTPDELRVVKKALAGWCAANDSDKDVELIEVLIDKIVTSQKNKHQLSLDALNR